MYVYKITNLINGLIYVGKTIRTISERWKGHISHANSKSKNKTYIQRAIHKYGHKNFKIEELCKCSSPEELSEVETKYILELKSHIHGIGYNLVIHSPNGGKYLHLSPESSKLKSFKVHNAAKKVNKFMGVDIYKNSKDKKPYSARISFMKKRYAKRFEKLEEALEAWDKISLFLYGKETQLNYPEKIDQYLKEDLNKFFKWFIFKPELVSGYHGVGHVNRKSKCWQSYVHIDKKYVSLGCFYSSLEAAIAYDKMAFYLKLKFLNFPEKASEYESMDLKKEYEELMQKKIDKFNKRHSIYRGIKPEKGKWIAALQLKSGKKSKHFNHEIDAARHYDKLAYQHYGMKAKLNFPNDINHVMQISHYSAI